MIRDARNFKALAAQILGGLLILAGCTNSDPKVSYLSGYFKGPYVVGPGAFVTLYEGDTFEYDFEGTWEGNPEPIDVDLRGNAISYTCEVTESNATGFSAPMDCNAFGSLVAGGNAFMDETNIKWGLNFDPATGVLQWPLAYIDELSANNMSRYFVIQVVAHSDETSFPVSFQVDATYKNAPPSLASIEIPTSIYQNQLLALDFRDEYTESLSGTYSDGNSVLPKRYFDREGESITYKCQFIVTDPNVLEPSLADFSDGTSPLDCDQVRSTADYDKIAHIHAGAEFGSSIEEGELIDPRWGNYYPRGHFWWQPGLATQDGYRYTFLITADDGATDASGVATRLFSVVLAAPPTGGLLARHKGEAGERLGIGPMRALKMYGSPQLAVGSPYYDYTGNGSGNYDCGSSCPQAGRVLVLGPPSSTEGEFTAVSEFQSVGSSSDSPANMYFGQALEIIPGSNDDPGLLISWGGRTGSGSGVYTLIADLTINQQIQSGGTLAGDEILSVGVVGAQGRSDLVFVFGQPNASPNQITFMGGSAFYANVLEASGISFGQRIISGRDLNGDTLADFVVSDPNFNSGVGKIYAYTSRASFDPQAEPPHALTGEIAGKLTNSIFGMSMDWVGDVNGDSFEDILVGAPAENSSAGAVYLYSLRWDDSGSQVVFDPIFSYHGTQGGEILGASVAGVGDFNGDGVPDFAVGAPGYDKSSPDMTDAGRVLVFSGKNHNIIAEFVGSSKDDILGTQISSAGDFNGDGLSDIAIGVPGADSSSGAIEIYAGFTTNDHIDLIPGLAVHFDATFLQSLRVGVSDSATGCDVISGTAHAASGYAPATPIEFVGCWKNRAGDGNDGTTITDFPWDAKQATANYRPGVGTLQGHTALSWDGDNTGSNNDYLYTSSIPALANHAQSVFIAAQLDPLSNTNEILFKSLLNTSEFYQLNIAPAKTSAITFQFATTSLGSPWSGSWSLNTSSILGSQLPFLLSYTIDSQLSPGSLDLDFNLIDGASSPFSEQGTHSDPRTLSDSLQHKCLFIGSGLTTCDNLPSTPTSFSFDGKMGEIIMINRALTMDERTVVKEYLESKWGI